MRLNHKDIELDDCTCLLWNDGCFIFELHIGGLRIGVGSKGAGELWEHFLIREAIE